MKKWAVIVIVFLFFGLACFGQAGFQKVVIFDSVSGDNVAMAQLSDSVFLVFCERFDPATIWKRDLMTINDDATDLCLWKIGLNGEVIEKLVFPNVEYESVEAICVANDGVFLISKTSAPGFFSGQYMGLRKLNLDVSQIELDTVLKINMPFKIYCVKMPDVGVGLIYDISDAINHKQTGFCPLYFDKIGGSRNMHFSKLVSKEKENFLGFFQRSSNLLNIYTNIGKDSIWEIGLDIGGDFLFKRPRKHVPAFYTNDKGYVFFGQYHNFVLYPKEVGERPRFDNSFSIKLYKADSLENIVIEKVLIPDTSWLISPPRAVQTLDNNILVFATLDSEEKSYLHIWKLDNDLNVIWQKWFDYYNYGFGECNIFENENGYTVFAHGCRKPSYRGQYGVDLFMMRIDNNGNLISQ